MDELVHGEQLILVDAGVDRRDGVCQVGSAGDVQACGGILGAAVLYGSAALDAALRQHAGEDDRISGLVHGLHHVIAVADHAVEVQDLLLESVLKFFDILEISGVSGLQAHQLARIGVDAVVQDEIDDLAHVDVTGVRGTVCRAASGTGLDAADDGPVAGFFDGAALAERHLHRGIVVEESGVSLAVLDHFAALADQRFGRAVPDAHRHDGLGGLQLVGDFEADVGQFVRSVLAVRGLAADDEDLPHGITGETGGIPVVAHFVDFAGL